MKPIHVLQITTVLAVLAPTLPLSAQSPGFAIANIGSNGVLQVLATDTYYDGNNGTTFNAVPLPAGASHLQFRVTGGVITDGTDQLGSADGLYTSGQTPYNWTDTDYDGSDGTYLGTPIGATTGIDPALFGVFFNPAFTGTPPNSLDFRSDAGFVPDLRTLASYSPLLNQPFYIGDGYTSNNAYVTNLDSFIPPGTNQTFAIPVGATELLLGIGADIDMADNHSASNTNSAFLAHVFDDSGSAPVIASVTGSGSVASQGTTWSYSVQLAAGATPLSYQWFFNGAILTNNSNISGAQSNILSFADVQSTNSGNYEIVVSNTFGQATNYPALEVLSTGQSVSFPNLTIPANAEIYGAGLGSLPDSSGVAPILVNLPAGALVVTLANVSGIITVNGGGGSNNADGVEISGSGYASSLNVTAYDGLSGITIPGAGAIIGVFEPATSPTGSAPPTLNFTQIGINFTTLAPELFQTFFMGDGLTGSGTGTTQEFFVPEGATRLFLGIADASGYNGSPGAYSDNFRSFGASVNVLVPIYPQITVFQVTGTNFTLAFQSVANQGYTVQSSTNLSGNNWVYFTNFIGDGLLDPVLATANTNQAQFFRVREP